MSSVLDTIRRDGFGAFDTETTGLKLYCPAVFHCSDGTDKLEPTARVFGVSACTRDLRSQFWRSDDPEFPEVKRVLADPCVHKVWFNAAYDLAACRLSGIKTSCPWDDMLLMMRLAKGNLEDFSLKGIAKKVLLLDTSAEDIVKAELRRLRAAYTRKGFPKGYVNYSHIDQEIMSKYAAEDARLTMILSRLLRDDVVPPPIWEAYRLDKAMVLLGIRMTSYGVFVDMSRLRRLRLRCERRLEALKNKLLRQAKRRGVAEPGWHKTAGLTAPYFVKYCNLPDFVFTKRGKTCSAVEVLEKLEQTVAKKVPEVPLVLQYRKVMKTYSTYVLPLIERAGRTKGIIHASWNVGGTATGRFSSSDPNLQNLTRPSGSGLDVRWAFRPRPGYWNLYSDYSQQELRDLAVESLDPKLIKIYQEGTVDVHQATADMLGLDRTKAKTLNFAILYGEGAAKLAVQLGVKMGRAREIIAAWFEGYTGVADLRNRLLDQLRRNGYVTDMFGKRYYIPNRLSYKVINYIIQGGCSIITKRAMRAVDEWLRLTNLGRLIMTIHDELVVEVAEHPKDLPWIARMISRRMTDIPEFQVAGVPMLVEHKVAKSSWADKEALAC